MDRPLTLRVALVISSLDAGGAERVMSIMANHWAARGWDITLVTIDVAASDFYALDPRVTRIALGVAGDSRGMRDALAHNVHRISRLRAALTSARPDVVISFMPPTNVLAVIAGNLAHVPVIVSERNDPISAPISGIWNTLRRLAYPRANAVVVQTPDVQLWAERFLPNGIVHTIPNPVQWPPDGSAETDGNGITGSAAPRTAHRVIAMGRLHPQKGFDVLLRAFAKARVELPDWSLLILGEGPERARLQALVSELGIASAVDMPGRVHNPSRILGDADLFVLSSRYEGFPNALLEAMAAGVAVVATDCRSGPRHIVRDGVDGVLVPPENADAMAAAMRTLMSNDADRTSMAARATEVRNRFSVDRVMNDWERLLQRVAPAAIGGA